MHAHTSESMGGSAEQTPLVLPNHISSKNSSNPMAGIIQPVYEPLIRQVDIGRGVGTDKQLLFDGSDYQIFL